MRTRKSLTISERHYVCMSLERLVELSSVWPGRSWRRHVSSVGIFSVVGMDPEILVNISFRLPQADRRTLADHLAPVVKEAIIAGGDTVHFALQPYDPEENGD